MKQLIFALCAMFVCVAAQAANPQVEIQTNKGVIIVELYPDRAPKTVDNFLAYVGRGFYNGTIFHRVIAGFMVQGGGYSPTYERKETSSPVANEADNGLKNQIGTIAMARTRDPHSATAQFFINVADNDFLDFRSPTASGYGYTVFGKVFKGMDVINQIAVSPTGRGGPFPTDVPVEPIIIEHVKVIGESK